MRAIEQIEPETPEEILDRYAERKIRRIVNQDNEASEALFSLIYRRRDDWDLELWEAALAEIDRSDLTVREFIPLENYRFRPK